MARHGEACTTHTLCVCTGIDRLSTDGFGGTQNSVLSCGLLVMDAARKTDIRHRRGMCLHPPAGVTSPVFAPPLFLVVPAECSAHVSWRFVFCPLIVLVCCTPPPSSPSVPAVFSSVMGLFCACIPLLLEQLLGLELFLNRYPEWRGKVTLIQVKRCGGAQATDPVRPLCGRCWFSLCFRSLRFSCVVSLAGCPEVITPPPLS